MHTFRVTPKYKSLTWGVIIQGHALAIASFFWICTTRAGREAIVLVSDPSRKVVDDNLRHLKSGPTRLSVPIVLMMLPPQSVERDAADVHAQTTCGCVVRVCGSVCCKTCEHISQGSNFTSNVTKKFYEVTSLVASMT